MFPYKESECVTYIQTMKEKKESLKEIQVTIEITSHILIGFVKQHEAQYFPHVIFLV